MLILASAEPIAAHSPQQLAARMPPKAVDDLLEWTPSRNVPGYLAQVVWKEFAIETALDPDPEVRITDDRPYNEYFLLRRWGLL